MQAGWKGHGHRYCSKFTWTGTDPDSYSPIFIQYPTVIGQNSNIGHRIYLFVFSVLGDYCAYVTVGIGKRGLESTPRMDV